MVLNFYNRLVLETNDCLGCLYLYTLAYLNFLFNNTLGLSRLTTSRVYCASYCHTRAHRCHTTWSPGAAGRRRPRGVDVWWLADFVWFRRYRRLHCTRTRDPIRPACSLVVPLWIERKRRTLVGIIKSKWHVAWTIFSVRKGCRL